MRHVPLEHDINNAINGPLWVEAANPFTAILISCSRGTCFIVLCENGSSMIWSSLHQSKNGMESYGKCSSSTRETSSSGGHAESGMRDECELAADLVVDEELEVGCWLGVERGAVDLELVPQRHVDLVTLYVRAAAGHGCKKEGDEVGGWLP